MAYLEESKVSKRFDGGLIVTNDEWATFFQHLFWLVRSNAALPIFHFMNDAQTILGSICQYGNVHFNTLTVEAEKTFLAIVEKTGFLQVDGTQCRSIFSKLGKITARQTSGT